MTRQINCQVNNEYVVGAGVVAGSALSHDDVLLHLTFNSLWTDLTKKITWLDAYGEDATLTILTTDMLQEDGSYLVPVPYEAKKYPGQMTMSIKGVSVDTHSLTSSIVSSTWEASSLGGTDGTFTFTYSDGWTYNSSSVTLSTYGITVTGTPVDGDKVIVTRASSVVTIADEEYHQEYRATLSATCEFTILDSTWDDDAEETQDVTSSQATQLQAEIETIKNINPYIGTNNHWWVWNNTDKAFVDTNIDARGTQGATGVGISSIAKTSTSGLIDTYTITFTDSTTTTFQVTNGAKGDTGSAAGFGTPTASVDSNVGTPSVTITSSGSDTEKVFNFEFHNLKGRDGTGVGDMVQSDYDSDQTVKNAGGIKAYAVAKETGKGLSTNDFTDTYKGNVDSNTSARHTHSNKSVLDGIASTDITSWNAKQSKPTYDTTRSISSSTGWTNNTYTTLNTPYPFSSYDIEVSISPDATSTQRDAYAEAMFTGHSDSNYITALGTKPTVDIPIVIKIWSKV